MEIRIGAVKGLVRMGVRATCTDLQMATTNELAMQVFCDWLDAAERENHARQCVELSECIRDLESDFVEICRRVNELIPDLYITPADDADALGIGEPLAEWQWQRMNYVPSEIRSFATIRAELERNILNNELDECSEVVDEPRQTLCEHYARERNQLFDIGDEDDDEDDDDDAINENDDAHDVDYADYAIKEIDEMDNDIQYIFNPNGPVVPGRYDCFCRRNYNMSKHEILCPNCEACKRCFGCTQYHTYELCDVCSMSEPRFNTTCRY